MIWLVAILLAPVSVFIGWQLSVWHSWPRRKDRVLAIVRHYAAMPEGLSGLDVRERSGGYIGHEVYRILHELESEGAVTARQEGKRRFYRLAETPARQP